VCLSYPYDLASNAVAVIISGLNQALGQTPDEVDSAIRDSIFSDDIFTDASPNGGEYHTQMKLAAYVFHSTVESGRVRHMESEQARKRSIWNEEKALCPRLGSVAWPVSGPIRSSASS
jgi:hypothetical protein